MQKIKSLIFVLVFVLTSVFTINVAGSDASALTKHKKTHKTKIVTAKSHKKVAKKSKTKKATKNKHKKIASHKSSKKSHLKRISIKKHSKKRVVSRRRQHRSKRKIAFATRSKRLYCRGSGRSLGSGNVMRVISYAKKYLGVNYIFGRSSSKAFDCSGFTMFVYRVAGIHLPHSAAGQSNLGLAVDKSSLRPGDLVFFETYKKGVSHVGIYIGNGRFIHASSGKGEVTITSLADAYYVQRYRGSTRILN